MLTLAVNPTSLFWGLAVLQVLGLASAALVRLTKASHRHVAFQRLFLCFLLLVGLAAIVSPCLGHGWFMGTGINLSVMILATVWDPGQLGRSLTP